jgi:hypothetical protein
MTQSKFTQQTDTIVLAQADWETVWHEGRLERVKPVPETWYDLRKVQGLPKGYPIQVLISCPRCKDANAVSARVTKISSLGQMRPEFVCGVMACRFRADIYLDKYHDKPLYALALENGERIELSYTHASTVEEASRGVTAKVLQGWRVIGIGPAIGYHVKPGSKGTVLIA